MRKHVKHGNKKNYNISKTYCVINRSPEPKILMHMSNDVTHNKIR